MGSDAPPVAIRPRSLGSRYIGAVGGNVRVRSLQSDRALARARYFRCLCYCGRKLNGPVTLAGGWFGVLRWQPTLAWGSALALGGRSCPPRYRSQAIPNFSIFNFESCSFLQEGRENANIDAGLGFIWRISVRSTGGGREPLTQLDAVSQFWSDQSEADMQLGRACRFDVNEHHAAL